MRSGAPSELESFLGGIFSSIDSVVGCLEGLDERELNWRPPAPETNSLYAIATHVLGNAEENILGTLCGIPVERHRELEFKACGSSSALVRERWRRLQERIRNAVANLAPSALDRQREHPRRGPLTGREVLLIVARHAAEHWGQAQLTRDLLKAEAGAPAERRTP
jgi:hypothetical protein